MKKIKLAATIDEEKIVFAIQKTKDMSRLEIVGLLDFIKKEIIEGMGEKIKIEKRD